MIVARTMEEIKGGYHSGHPWYYLLGNRVLTPKQIRDDAKASSYRGYRADDIRAAIRKPEPQRSEFIRKIRMEVMADLRKDITRYRQCAVELHAYRREHGVEAFPRSCDDVHVAISLKRNHIYNGFAHLALLDELPAQQGDLFGL